VATSKFCVDIQALTWSDLGGEHDYSSGGVDLDGSGKDTSNLPAFVVAIYGVILLTLSITREKRASGKGI
jgi:hypothetical protein